LQWVGFSSIFNLERDTLMNIPHSQTQQPTLYISNENTFLPIYINFAGLFEKKFEKKFEKIV